MFEPGIRDGLAQAKLLDQTKVAAEVLAAGRRRIDWDDYVRMLENYHAELGLEGIDLVRCASRAHSPQW